jgi:hypothetical protein
MAAVKLTRLSTNVFQALIVGRVVDDVTQAAPANPVRLELQGNGVDWSPETLRLMLKQLDDGSFAYYGDPLTAFPDKAHTYHLQLTASVDGYSPKLPEEITIGPLNAQPQEVTFTAPMPEIGAIPTRLYRGAGLPKRGIRIALTRAAISLHGLVTNANEPAIKVDSASIKVKQAYDLRDGKLSNVNVSTTTDTNGLFTIQLPVAQAVVIEVEQAQYQKQSFTHTIDYSQPVNTVQFALFPKP